MAIIVGGGGGTITFTVDRVRWYVPPPEEEQGGVPLSLVKGEFIAPTQAVAPANWDAASFGSMTAGIWKFQVKGEDTGVFPVWVTVRSDAATSGGLLVRLNGGESDGASDTAYDVYVAAGQTLDVSGGRIAVKTISCVPSLVGDWAAATPTLGSEFIIRGGSPALK